MSLGSYTASSDKKFRYGDLNLYMLSHKDYFNFSAFQASRKPMEAGGVQGFSEVFGMKSNWKSTE